MTVEHRPNDPFAPSRARFEQLCTMMGGEEAAVFDHGALESRLELAGRELLRQLYQDHLDLRAMKERRVAEVTDASGITRRFVEAGHRRGLETIFGPVTVTRLAYRARRADNLHPQDAALNLPRERHSHGLRRCAAIESCRGSYDEASAAIVLQSGVLVAKRQLLALCAAAAVDFSDFYERSTHDKADDGDVLVLSMDGKGIVMRPDALRPATRKAAASATNKLKTRLSKGEKRNRKRMAEVGTVYDVAPFARAPSEIIGREDDAGRPLAPKAKRKWLTASVVDDAAEVIGAVFDEASRRDPDHERTWVALVDGARHQIDCIEAEAKARHVTVHLVVDIVHVLEYLWFAAWSFFDEGDHAAEEWVADKAIAVLSGKAATVASSIRRKATTLGLECRARENADTCANYLLAKKNYLDYPSALAAGWPIATGVIEGAVRHLVKDRLDLTGSRWGLEGAETILKLRALRTNGDFDAYWDFHVERERERVHASRYADGLIPEAA